MRALFIPVILAVASTAHGAPLRVGDGMPALVVEGAERGLLKLTDSDTITYGRFDSRTLIPGKVRVIMQMAARLGAESDGQHLFDALEGANFGPSRFQVLVVVSADDCLFGTCLFVRGQLADNQRERPTTAMVYDDTGRARRVWGLPKGAFTAIITDRRGRIVRWKTGKFSASEAKAYVGVLRGLIAAD
jgi:YtfJ family uncharacterized protein